MKTRFQHIHEASVLGFDVDPYIDVVPADLSFSLDDLQYLLHHFEIFSTVSLFGLTVEENERVTRLDAYLNTRDTSIAYQEMTYKALQTQHQVSALLEPVAKVEAEIATPYTLGEHSLTPVAANDAIGVADHQDIIPNDPEDKDHNLMGPSVLDNTEISIVNILSVEFQPTTSQPSFLDGDLVAEETT